MDSYNQQSPQPPASQGTTLQALQPQSKNWVLIVLIVVITAVLASAATYFAVSPQKQPQPTPPLPSEVLTKESSPTPTPDPTANWKTYSGMDFTFQYPNDWNLKIDSSVVKIQKEQYLEKSGPRPAQTYTNSIEVFTKMITEATTLEDWFETRYGEDKVVFPIMQKSAQRIKVGGVDALAVEVPGAAGYHTEGTLVVYKNQGYHISTIGLRGMSGIEEAYKTIVSTFKFTNP